MEVPAPRYCVWLLTGSMDDLAVFYRIFPGAGISAIALLAHKKGGAPWVSPKVRLLPYRLHVQEIPLHKMLLGSDPVPDTHVHHLAVPDALLFDALLVPAFPVHHIKVEPACRIITRL